MSAAQARDAPDLIKRAFAHRRDRRNALREAGLLISARIAGHARTTEPNRGVRLMMKWASENIDRAFGINDAINDVGLSPSRASHLFVEETGLPFRT